MASNDEAITGRRLGYIRSLDGLRAIAAIAVVGFHARLAVFAHGDIGVDIFFVLSGFLITSILIGRSGVDKPIDFRDFYRRRALRLLPAYGVVVLASVVVESVSDSEHLGLTPHGLGTLKGAAFSSVYMGNWAAGLSNMGLGLLAHTWSLSIEEQFYLVWPALLAVLLRRYGWSARGVLRAVAALVLVSWLAVVVLGVMGAPARIASNATPTRAVELLCGGLLAVFVASPGLSGPLGRAAVRSRQSVLGAVALVALVALVPLFGASEATRSILGWPLISVLTCGVIYACLRDVKLVVAPLGNRLMAGIGKRSYGLYLWHFPIFVVIDTRWGLDSWGARLAAVGLTGVVVMLSYRFIERPFLERKDARRPPAAAPVPARAPDAALVISDGEAAAAAPLNLL